MSLPHPALAGLHSAGFRLGAAASRLLSSSSRPRNRSLYAVGVFWGTV